MLSTSLGVRVVVAILLLAPLGLCLGMFMPLGLGAVAAPDATTTEEYVAWAWAVNGFFSVIGSVLTTILSMTFGFRLVQLSRSPSTRSPCSRSRASTGGATMHSRADAPAIETRPHSGLGVGAGAGLIRRNSATSATAASTASDGSAAARNRVWP